jgi:hypothetical protein
MRQRTAAAVTAAHCHLLAQTLLTQQQQQQQQQTMQMH